VRWTLACDVELLRVPTSSVIVVCNAYACVCQTVRVKIIMKTRSRAVDVMKCWVHRIRLIRPFSQAMGRAGAFAIITHVWKFNHLRSRHADAGTSGANRSAMECGGYQRSKSSFVYIIPPDSASFHLILETVLENQETFMPRGSSFPPHNTLQIIYRVRYRQGYTSVTALSLITVRRDVFTYSLPPATSVKFYKNL